MPDLTIQLSSTAESEFSANGTSIRADIIANPGTTEAAIAGRLTLAQPLVERVVAMLERSKTVIRAQDTAGASFLWGMGSFGDLVFTNYAAAKSWVSLNDGSTVAAMAAALPVHEAIAIRLAEMLFAEAYVKLTSA